MVMSSRMGTVPQKRKNCRCMEIGVCHGTSPTGIVMTVTRAEGNRILELDGRPAAEVFRDATGYMQSEILQQEHLTSWAIAVERTISVPGPHGPEQRHTFLIWAATGIDKEGPADAHAKEPDPSKVPTPDAQDHRSRHSVFAVHTPLSQTGVASQSMSHMGPVYDWHISLCSSVYFGQ